MKRAVAVTDLIMYALNFACVWISLMLGLSESYQNATKHTVPCKEGWYLYGEKCYKIMGEENKLPWKQASDMCLLQQGNLATIYSKDLQEFLTTFLLINSHHWSVWIGLNDRENEEDYVWADGSPLNFTFWEPNEPKGRNSDQKDCVEMRFSEKFELGRWKETECDWKTVYMCQADKDTNESNPDPRFCSEEENGGWKYLNSCYHVVQEKMAWEEAEYYCQEVYGGHLVKILDHQTQLYINYVFSNQSTFWIGIQIKKQKLQKWSSGWPAGFTKWDDEQIHFIDGTCAVMTTKKTWSSAPCFNKYPFVCETSKDPSFPILNKAPTEWICPTASSDWIDIGGDTCYIFERSKTLSWFAANFYCHKKGGSLASIHSDIETALLKPFIFNTSSPRYLIGLHRANGGKIFEWADGSELDYENWGWNEPNNEHEWCGELWTDSMLWNDVSCSIEATFICTARKVPPLSNQECQCQCQTTTSTSAPVSAPRNSSKRDVSKIKREISLKTAIGIPVLMLVLFIFIGITIFYYKKSYIPGFRFIKKTTSVEEVDTGAVPFSKL